MTLSRKTAIVAWWEFIERVKTRSFLVGLFVMPLLMALLILGPAMLSNVLEENESRHIVVHDGTGVVFDSLHAAMARGPMLSNGKPKYMLQAFNLNAGDSSNVLHALDSILLLGMVDATIHIPVHALDSQIVHFRADNVSDIEGINMFRRHISNIISSHKMKDAGLDPHLVSSLKRETEIRTVRVTERGEKETGFLESFGLSYVFIILTMIMILSSGQMLVRSMVEEKSNRIVEVLVSSCSPMDLMFGKILGMGLLAFVPVVLWTLIGMGMLSTAELGDLPLDNLWLMVLYFILGFLLYAALFVALGCLTSTEQEAQQMTGYLSILLVLPIVIAFIASQSPNNPVLVVLTMLPFITPQMMFIRLPISTPPLWEIILSLVILVVAIVALTWVAARIFRVGILLTGKRPGVGEILRWLRS
jgi:ABC-2 type transport system permease protein